MQGRLVLNNSCLIRAREAGLFVSTGQRVDTRFLHDEYELVFVQRGTLHLYEGRAKYAVEQSQAFLVWPHRTHGIMLSESDDVSFYWILFEVESGSVGKDEEEIRIPKIAAVQQPERVLELLQRFMDDRRTDRLTQMMGSHLIALILCEIHRSANAAGQANGKKAGLADSVQVYISKHFHDPISTSVIAADLNYNPDYLERIFCGVTGMSITEAIHKKRVKEARRQLMYEYRRNVSEIAYACGFSDSGYFRRIFKRHTDMTPTKFRSLYSQVHMKVG